MKIGIDLRMYSTEFTGIGRYNFELTERLITLDTVNEYVFFLNEPEYSDFVHNRAELLKDERFKAVRVDAPHYSLKEQTSFLKALNKENLDLMHFTHFNAPLLYRKPCVVTIHDLTLSFFPGKKFTKWYHRLAYQMVLKNIVKKSKKIIAVSKHTEIDLHRLFNFTRKKTVMIHEGANDHFKKLPINEVIDVINKYEIDKGYVLYTGVHRDHKNVVGLIAAFAKLTYDKGFDGYLVLTGKENPHYPEVKETIKKLHLEDRVKMVGLVPEHDLIALYNGATVYAYPSFYEGFGLPALEAYACGTAVCASNAACIPEICGDAALFFDPKNTEEMAEKLYELISNDALRDRLIQKGYERLKEFSFDDMAKETLEVYNSATTTQQ